MNATVSHSSMEPVDYLRSGALIVAFVGSAFVAEVTWLQTEIIVSVATGAALFLFPNTLLSYQVNGDLDIVNKYMSQLMGLTFLTTAVSLFYLRHCKDKNVVVSICVSRIVACIGMLTVMLMAKVEQPKLFPQQHLTFGTLGVSLWLLRNLIQLGRCSTFGGGNAVENDRFTKLQLVDIIIVILSFVLNFGFPDYNLSYITMNGFKMSPVHVYQLKVMSCLILGYLILAISSLNFQSIHDRKAIILGRMAMIASYLLVFQWYQQSYRMVESRAALVPGAMVLLNSAALVVAYFFLGRDKSD